MNTVRVELGPRSYDIAIVSNDPAGLGPFIRERVRGTTAFVITDTNARPHAKAAVGSLDDAGGFRNWGCAGRAA